MDLAISGQAIAAEAIAIVCLPLAVMVVMSLPTQLRDKRLKRRGIETDAVCVERVRTSGVTVHYVRCHFRLENGIKISAMINSPRPAPEVGHSFQVVYDPLKPSDAASAQYLAGREAKLGYVLQAALAVLVTAAVLLVTVFS
ncbi:hypothetical protein [Streptomyces sp. enrichment culture]|uniref:hypothetical protein n=1 Tax=Streptomyces sp. enrichment culture TaxID=1795815 RepID=UPI003F55170D